MDLHKYCRKIKEAAQANEGSRGNFPQDFRVNPDQHPIIATLFAQQGNKGLICSINSTFFRVDDSVVLGKISYTAGGVAREISFEPCPYSHENNVWVFIEDPGYWFLTLEENL